MESQMGGPSPSLRGERLLTLPNAISALRLASVPVFLWLFVAGAEVAAAVLYGIGAASDFFDGYIARRTGSVTELGKVLDPLADRVLIVALVIALVARDALPWWLAAAVAGRDVVVLAAYLLLARRGAARIDVNFAGKTATACLLFGLTWLLASFVWEELGRWVGLAFVAVGAAIYWYAALLYAGVVREGLRAGRQA